MLKSMLDLHKKYLREDEIMEDLNKVIYWQLSDQANLIAMGANDSRAIIEEKQLTDEKQIIDIHSEALSDFSEIERMVMGGIDFLRLLKIPFSGQAADLGSGVGTGAVIVSKLPDITRVYAIEYAEQFVLKTMPLVFNAFNANQTKIIRVVGDFNNIRLENESLSLIVEIDSFHHAENIELTLKECYRVLRPGGAIVAVDRSWPDSISREELEKKLEIEYSETRKALYGIPPHVKYTRRDNGEHEYRDSEWIAFFNNAGFDANVFSQIHPPKFNSLVFQKIPTFKYLIKISSFLYKFGLRHHNIYGFNATRKLIVAIKL